MGHPGVPPERFRSAYDGVPPWDIGRPQPEFVRALDAGLIRGDVLDVGCGTGENALHLAARGRPVLGVDAAPAAIERARAKGRARGLEATFEVRDALDLEGLGRTFDTIIDSGLFHVFSDADRPRFVSSLRAALRPGGRYLLLCFSDRQPGIEGPRRVSQAEIRATFGAPLRVEFVREARFETNTHEGGARAWFASIDFAEGAAAPPVARPGGLLRRILLRLRHPRRSRPGRS
jgi:SAM-dependent methyltransferase